MIKFRLGKSVEKDAALEKIEHLLHGIKVCPSVAIEKENQPTN